MRREYIVWVIWKSTSNFEDYIISALYFTVRGWLLWHSQRHKWSPRPFSLRFVYLSAVQRPSLSKGALLRSITSNSNPETVQCKVGPIVLQTTIIQHMEGGFQSWWVRHRLLRLNIIWRADCRLTDQQHSENSLRTTSKALVLQVKQENISVRKKELCYQKSKQSLISSI